MRYRSYSVPGSGLSSGLGFGAIASLRSSTTMVVALAAG
jgi:hypothetical protein